MIHKFINKAIWYMIGTKYTPETKRRGYKQL